MSDIPEDVRDAAKSALRVALKDVRTGTAIKMSMFGPDKQAFEEAIARAILDERERNQWQPIESAPRDGSRILAVDQYGARIIWWGAAAYNRKTKSWTDGGNYGYRPTHWMPIPAAPKGGEA